jgi:hypothetical protein
LIDRNPWLLLEGLRTLPSPLPLHNLRLAIREIGPYIWETAPSRGWNLPLEGKSPLENSQNVIHFGDPVQTTTDYEGGMLPLRTSMDTVGGVRWPLDESTPVQSPRDGVVGNELLVAMVRFAMPPHRDEPDFVDVHCKTQRSFVTWWIAWTHAPQRRCLIKHFVFVIISCSPVTQPFAHGLPWFTMGGVRVDHDVVVIME